MTAPLTTAQALQAIEDLAMRPLDPTDDRPKQAIYFERFAQIGHLAATARLNLDSVLTVQSPSPQLQGAKTVLASRRNAEVPNPCSLGASLDASGSSSGRPRRGAEPSAASRR